MININLNLNDNKTIIFIISVILIIFGIFALIINKFYKCNIKVKNIPKNIFLCYKNKNIPSYIIPTWKKLNPEYNIELYDDNDCINFLRTNYGQEYVDIFNYIQDGPIKGDFWRVCVLYIRGGVYSDVDVMPIVPIRDFLDKDATFLTCTSVMGDLLNPHFIICPAKDPIIKSAVDTYVRYYRDSKPYSYWGWSIVFILTNIISQEFKKNITNEGIYIAKNGRIFQILKEVQPKILKEVSAGKFKQTLGTLHDVYCSYNNKIIMYNRFPDYDASNHQFKKK
jgi:hypothetical protein